VHSTLCKRNIINGLTEPADARCIPRIPFAIKFRCSRFPSFLEDSSWTFVGKRRGENANSESGSANRRVRETTRRRDPPVAGRPAAFNYAKSRESHSPRKWTPRSSQLTRKKRVNSYFAARFIRTFDNGSGLPFVLMKRPIAVITVSPARFDTAERPC